MYRWIDTNENERNIDSLESFLEGCNNSNHSSIGLHPNVAGNNKSIHQEIRENVLMYYNIFTKTKFRFRIGEILKIKLLPQSSF